MAGAGDARHLVGVHADCTAEEVDLFVASLADSLDIGEPAGRAEAVDGARRTDGYVDLSRVRLAELLVDAQRDLTGFLARLDAWARRSGLGSRAAALVAAVDRSLAVTAPLDLIPSGGGAGTPNLT